MLKLKIRNICRCCSVGVVAFVVVCGWSIAMINAHPIATTFNLIVESNSKNKSHTTASYGNNPPSSSHHSTQSSSAETIITNQPSTTHFIKYENVIYKLILSTDGKQRRWIYVTPLYNHHNETKGNDASGHTGNKRTVMKVSNAIVPITLSTIRHINDLYENFNHNNHKVNNVKNDDNIQNANVSGALLNTLENFEDDNRKLEDEKLSYIEWKDVSIHKNFKQSNNGTTNESNEYRNMGENHGKEKSFQNGENGRSFNHRRNEFNPFDKNLCANDGVVNKNRFHPLIKNDLVKNVANGNDLSTYQRHDITTIATSLTPSLCHPHSNEFTQNHYRLIEGRHRKYILRSNLFHSDEVTDKHRFGDEYNNSFDPVVLQLILTHHENIIPQPHFWGIRGYGLYSFAAGNDLHNNQPNGAYKIERDFDN
ncbi:hypothetical protein Bhyg_11012 [Pseudolycoriella hygida]|uniref:Uncharacterized protein n=1 Tax=Pseudolycoriella hygida TaxID=35572 RepID=A0A9Q0RZS7_9DIPT|nr:hypothetical protein Bhyg_11012 [Pseudolycoriella hygida]